jgi:hypothetical protein
MHDWTLLWIFVDWHKRSIDLRLRNMNSEEVSVVVHGFTELRVPRRDEWGPSVSINSVTGPSATPNGNQLLTIQMQTGDEIAVEGSSIMVPTA